MQKHYIKNIKNMNIVTHAYLNEYTNITYIIFTYRIVLLRNWENFIGDE